MIDAQRDRILLCDWFPWIKDGVIRHLIDWSEEWKLVKQFHVVKGVEVVRKILMDLYIVKKYCSQGWG